MRATRIVKCLMQIQFIAIGLSGCAALTIRQYPVLESPQYFRQIPCKYIHPKTAEFSLKMGAVSGLNASVNMGSFDLGSARSSGSYGVSTYGNTTITSTPGYTNYSTQFNTSDSIKFNHNDQRIFYTAFISEVERLNLLKTHNTIDSFAPDYKIEINFLKTFHLPSAQKYLLDVQVGITKPGGTNLIRDFHIDSNSPISFWEMSFSNDAWISKNRVGKMLMDSVITTLADWLPKDSCSNP